MTDCPMCLEPAGTNGGIAHSLSCACNTSYCPVCIYRWLQESATCPTCRAPARTYQDFLCACRALIAIGRSDGNNTCSIDSSRFGMDPAALANPAWVKAAVAALEQDGYEVDIRRPNGGQYQKLVVAW